MRLIAAAETWDDQPSATMSVPAKPRCCSHFPCPLTPLWEPNHTHTTEHNSKHTCSITTKPLSVFTQLHPKAPTGISIALSLQAHESSNTLGFAATAYIRLYLTHIMAVRKRKIRTFYRSNGKFQLLDALIEVG